ncbi:MAG: ABC transporter permease [Thaumarchaeota archaeon]|nr:ABC transporter permease [Nitrososphaerota archaeon]
MSRTLAIFTAVTRNWLRSRSGLFFSFLFPVIFLLLFGSIFSGNGSSTYNLSVQNNDLGPGGHSALSKQFIQALNSTKVLNLKNVSSTADIASYTRNASSFVNGNPRVLVIPEGFQANISKGLPVALAYFSSPADQAAPVVAGVISSAANAFNFIIAGAHPLISFSYQSTSVKVLRQVDYYIPGITGAFMMTNGVIGLTNIATEFKRRGITKRLSATPLTKLDWILGNVLSQAVLAIALTAVMIALGVGLFQSAVTIDAYTVVIVILGALLFSGMGMLLAGLVKDPEAASGLGNAIAFPMMFLSGTFWPIEIMPKFLQQVAQVLPLTYFADGLRDSMILNNTSAATTNIMIVGALAIVFVGLGALVTRWKEK